MRAKSIPAATLCAAAVLLSSGCQALSSKPSEAGHAAASSQPTASRMRTEIDDEKIPLAIVGIDHLPDHVSVQTFSVDGRGNAQAGQGGRAVCCISVPRKWKPGMKVTVRWGVLNWRDWRGDEYQTVVDVEPYTELDQFYVHFLPNGTVRAIVSAEGPRSPTYIGPHDPIPQKYPWKVFGPRDGPTHCVDHTISPPVPCKD
jgi:hypothetical protein